MAARFAALPSWWFREGNGVKIFEGGSQAGESIAALKVMISICLLMNYHSKKAKNSLSDLEKLSGLSRPMVVKGIAALERQELIKVDRTGHISEYELLENADDKNFAKLPYERFRTRLAGLPNRGDVALGALKIYLTLAAIRPNNSADVAFGHENLRIYTGMQKRRIRPALDVLYSHNLIRLKLVEGGEPGETKHRHNLYTLLGL